MKGRLLKELFAASGLSQTGIARKVPCAKSSLSTLVHRGEWPRKNPAGMRRRLREILRETAIADADITAAFKQLDATVASVPASAETDNPKEFWMLRKQVLTQAAKRKFGLGRDPFGDEFSGPEDVFLSRDARYVLESMYQTARHGGMMACVGESGSGKTTLRRTLISRLAREDAKVIVIEPYTLGMDNGNKIAPSLRSSHICESILAQLDPRYKGNNVSPEARFRHMHKRLKESTLAGFRHLVILEEAHSLPIYTIKHLKRFWELTDEHTMARLVSFLLIGQQELMKKLSETSAETREITQRMEVVELFPMEETEGYVRHRLEQAGGKFDEVFAPDALDALALRLNGPAPKSGGRGTSQLYPLMVGNMLTKAFNLAADLKAPRVDAGIIQQA